VPRDAQEGDTVAVEGHDLELRLGEPVAFPLASSSVRPQDRPGDLAPRDPDSIRDLPPLVGLMKTGRKAKADRVGVQLTARVTEVGTVELWCASRIDDRRWRLQIQLRGPSGAAGSSGPGGALASIVGQAEADAAVLEQKVVDAACDAVRAAFAAARAQDDPGPARLIKKLEEVLELPRDQWPPSALRALWEPLRDVAERRKVSPQHEARWLNLAGYCLRPGTGYPLDEARIKALWPVFHAGLDHVKDTQCWVEWWVLWRRVAAGLNRSHHDEIYRRLQPYLAGAKSGLSAAPPVPSGRKPSRPKPEPHELAEMARCAASLERLSAATKEMLGKALVMVLVNPTPTPHLSWCLGRVGARVPLYGPADTVVPPDVASEFLKALLSLPEPSSRERADRVFALASLARVSGDRARDIDEALRARVLDRMAALGADEATLDPVREYRELGASQQGLALGDSLPTGLRLVAATADGA
jgi:hypothetical protein